jgi:hypothetical protein
MLLLALPAFGQQAHRNWSGLSTLTLSTNFVAASGVSNAYSIVAQKDVVVLTITNAPVANDSIVLNDRTIFAVASATTVEANPSVRFLLNTNLNVTTTNLYGYLSRYPIPGVVAAYSSSNAITLTATPSGSISVAFNAGAFAEAATTSTTYTADAYVKNESDNLTLVVTGQAAGATTAALSFTFAGAVENVAKGENVVVAVTLNGTTAASYATNFACTWPGMKLVSVGVGAGANVTNYTVRYGSMQ